MSPVTFEGPTFVTEGVAPRIPNEQAAPKGSAPACGHASEVVNVHTKLVASLFPIVSAAPVVIVAVYVVLAARAAVGVKVAILLVAL
jgi:hypothetical protein